MSFRDGDKGSGNPSHMNSDQTAASRSCESAAVTSSGKITFSKAWTVEETGAGG